MSNQITVYYYTAWDGFAWQGCDEATAKSLQGYMDAAGTLPESSARHPPFGGAVPCKIDGKVGVAVYRYHVRENGDISGRDSLYIALAFVPLESGRVDFAKLLECPQLSSTKPGALRPEPLAISNRDIALQDGGSTPFAWMDRGLGNEFRELYGRSGLQTLSRLFFSEQAQLGFLNAVFASASGVDGIVSVQTYHVYREVASVAGASLQFASALERAGGALSRDDKAVVDFQSALEALDKWAAKTGYTGLRKYYEEKKAELDDQAGRQKKIADYIRELDNLYKIVKEGSKSGETAARGVDPEMEKACGKCIDKAKAILSLPVVDDEQYKKAVALAFDAIERSSLAAGCIQGVERGRLECKSELEELRRQLERTQQEAKAAPQLKSKTGSNCECTESASHICQASASALVDGGAVTGRKRRGKHRRYDWMAGWPLYGAIVAVVVVVGLICMNFPGNPSGPAKAEPGESGRITSDTGTVVYADASSTPADSTALPPEEPRCVTERNPAKPPNESKAGLETQHNMPKDCGPEKPQSGSKMVGPEKNKPVEVSNPTNKVAKANPSASETEKAEGEVRK